MVLPELLREIESRGVTLEPAGDRLRFRPKRNLTPALVEGLREHKAAILEALEGPKVRSTAEVLEMARAHFGEIAPESREVAPYPPPEPGRDPLVHKHTGKARFSRGVRARDLQRREREGLPPWIRIVDGGGDAA